MLIKRPLPFFRFGGLTDFGNTPDVQGMTTERDTTLVMQLPANVQFTPPFSPCRGACREED